MKFCLLRKNIMAVISLTIVVFFLLSTATPILGKSYSSANTQSKPELTPNNPIYINSNNNFTTANGVNNPSATGTEIDPYIIENWDINVSSAIGIDIENTNAYFIIKNCAIHDGYDGVYPNYNGIHFYNITNGKIENCSVYNNNYGIYLQESSNNNVNMNQIYNSNNDGMLLQFSSNNNNITSNQIHNNSGDGISLSSSSDNNNILYNQIYDNHGFGIILSSSSNNNITGNYIYNNSWDGVDLSSSSNNIITLNLIYNHNGEGISLYCSSNNQISNCSVYNNDRGVSFEYSSNNEIHYNNIYNNTDYGVYNYQTYVANATYNWWGSSDGPSGVGPGNGDKITNGVVYDPWLSNKWGGPKSYVNPIIPFWYNTNTLLILIITANATEPVFPQGNIKNLTLYYRYKTEGSATWTEWAEYAVITNKPWRWGFNTTEIQTGNCYYGFYSIATDTNLNIEPPPSTADTSCGIDTTPPVTSIDDALTSGWQKNTIVVLNATDTLSSINKTYFKIWENNTIEPMNWTINHTFTIADNGVWNLKYYSTDNAGNNENIINKTIQVDTIAPNTTHNLNPAISDGLNNYYITPVTIQLISSDMHSGVNNTFYIINTGEWHKLNITSESFTISQDGDYQVEYYSVDNAENNENINFVSFKIDVTSPQISITNITSDAKAKTITVTWTTTSPDIESYMVKIDNGEWVNVGITNPYVNSYTFINIVSGEHNVYVKAVDNAGNTNIKQQWVPDKNKDNGDIFWIILITILLTIIVAIIVAVAIIKYKLGRKKRIEKEGGGD